MSKNHGSEKSTRRSPESASVKPKIPEQKRSNPFLSSISSRAKITALVAIFGGLLASAALIPNKCGGSSESNDSKQRTSSNVVPNIPDGSVVPVKIKKPTEELTDELIAKVESGMAIWGTRLLPIIDSLPDKKLKEELKSVFEIVEINSKNPNKNNIRFVKDRKDGEMVELSNPNFFGYEADKVLPEGIVAGFSPPPRKMKLSTDFDPNNGVQIAVLAHELKHALIDAGYRSKMGSKEEFDSYMEFYTVDKNKDPNDIGRLIINDEATAYAYEIELLNIMLGGDLQRSFSGGPSLNSVDVLQRLNASMEDMPTLSLILELASYYYPHAMSDGLMSKEFFEAIAKYYRKKGTELYIQSSTGGLKRY